MTTDKILGLAAGFVAAACAWLCLLMANAAATDVGARFARGIGLSHVMGWAAVEPGSAHAFTYPPFADPSRALTATELQTIKRAGFDYVRLAVDPGPFLQFQGTRRDEMDRVLLGRVKLILASGLAVIVDFQPSDLNPDYTAQNLTAGLDMPIFQDYLRLLGRTARLLAALHSDQVAFELMNEPPVRPDEWQPMLEAVYAAARSSAAELPLVLEGGDEASVAALTAMRTSAFAADPAALFSFHYYDPYQFTHQGASWNPARYLADVPYPALARPLNDSLEATAGVIAKNDLAPAEKYAAYRDARARLEAYRRSAFDADSIAAAFDRVAAWARAQHLPPDRIMLGEFGARKIASQRDVTRAAEREKWFHDVSAAAQARGFGWGRVDLSRRGRVRAYAQRCKRRHRSRRRGGTWIELSRPTQGRERAAGSIVPAPPGDSAPTPLALTATSRPVLRRPC